MKSKFKKFYNFLILIIAFINLLSLFVKMNQNKVKFKSEVTLKVKGTEIYKILSESFFKNHRPYGIYINDSFRNISKNVFYFNGSEIDTNKSNNEYYPTGIINEHASIIEENFDDLEDNNNMDENLQL